MRTRHIPRVCSAALMLAAATLSYLNAMSMESSTTWLPRNRINHTPRIPCCDRDGRCVSVWVCVVFPDHVRSSNRDISHVFLAGQNMIRRQTSSPFQNQPRSHQRHFNNSSSGASAVQKNRCSTLFFCETTTTLLCLYVTVQCSPGDPCKYVLIAMYNLYKSSTRRQTSSDIQQCSGVRVLLENTVGTPDGDNSTYLHIGTPTAFQVHSFPKGGLERICMECVGTWALFSLPAGLCSCILSATGHAGNAWFIRENPRSYSIPYFPPDILQ